MNAPLDMLEKNVHDKKVFDEGPPTASLHDFVENILAEAIGDNNTLSTFYDLVNRFGLTADDKVLNGSPVLMAELISALERREDDENALLEGFEDMSEHQYFDFWETLKKESQYSIFRDQVENAYMAAGKTKYPWWTWGGQFVWLDVSFKLKGFGLPANAEEFQDTLLQDSWTWDEALCWLKGRYPDKCRLHQLPKYYADEVDLIMRAIKAGKLTIDSSTPKEWIDWALSKGWIVPKILMDSIDNDLNDDGTEVENDQPTATKKELPYTSWLRETWEAEGRPKGTDFFYKLKSYNGKEGSPVLSWYTTSNQGPGIRLQVETKILEHYPKSQIQKKVSEFKSEIRKQETMSSEI
jgi:hypothetical protein